MLMKKEALCNIQNINEFQKRTIYYVLKEKRLVSNVASKCWIQLGRNERPAKVPHVIWGSLDRADS